MDRRQNLKRNVKIYVWLFAGLLLCFATALMRTTGSLNINAFFDVGEVYDFGIADTTLATDSCQYDESSEQFTVIQDKAKKTFKKITTNAAWGYLNLNVSNLNRESAQWIIRYYDADKVKLGEQECTILSGDNLIPIVLTGEFRYVKFIIRDQAGETFCINSMQLRQTNTGFSSAVFLQSFLQFGGLYMLISLLIFAVKRLNWYTPIEILQYGYTLFGDYAGSRITKNLDEKAKNRLRTLLFFFLFLISIIWKSFGLYGDENAYKYGILLCVLSLVVIGILSWEKNLQEVKWNGFLPTAWFVLWTWACVSDLMISKYFKFTGYAMIFGIGLFFFIWNQMSFPKKIINNMIQGLELTLPIVTVYCIFFRQKEIGVIYNGCFANREDMSLYALALLIVFLAELNMTLSSHQLKKIKRRIMLYGVGASFSVYYLYRSWTVSCMVVAGVVLVIWLMIQWKKRTKLALGITKTVGLLIATVAVSALFVIPAHIAMKTIPDELKTSIVYEDELQETTLDTTGIANVRLLYPDALQGVAKVTDQSKLLVWTNYMRKLNLFGNADMLKVSRVKTATYNGLLEMAYRYGIFVLIPYVLMIYVAIRYVWKEKKFLMLAVVAAFSLTMIVQNVELPFANPLWILFYIGMGMWFIPSNES